MAFSFVVELLDMSVRKNQPNNIVELTEPHYQEAEINEGDQEK